MKVLSNYLFIVILLFNFICKIKSQSTIKEILSDFEKGCKSAEKKYELKTLGYITPWNKEGYNIVEKYANKFDLVSPTWYELKYEESDGEFFMIIDAGNNIDVNYIEKVREKNKNMKIVPRLHIQHFSEKIYNLWFGKSKNQFLQILERRIRYNKVDGIVLDCMELYYMGDKIYNNFVYDFLPDLQDLFKKTNKTLIITAIPLSRNNRMNFFNENKFKELSQYVDYINIMTYDYHSYKSRQENILLSPISWIQETVKFLVNIENKNDKLSNKILLGLPFYGTMISKDYKLTPLKNKEFMNMLKHDKFSMNFNENEKEFTFKDEKGNEMLYPTNLFIKERLKLSKKLNLGGVGIWEIGMGDEYLLNEI